MDKNLALRIIAECFGIENNEQLDGDLDYTDLTNHRCRLVKSSSAVWGEASATINCGLYKYAVDMLRKYASEDAANRYMAENAHMSGPLGIRGIKAGKFIIDDKRDALHRYVKSKFGGCEYSLFEFDDVDIDGVTYIVAWD